MQNSNHLSISLLQNAEQRADNRINTHSATSPSNYSHGDIVRLSGHFAAHLQQADIGAGDVVALHLPAWADWLIAALGSLRIGATLLPISTILGPAELGYILRDSQAVLYIGPSVWRKRCHRELLDECGDIPTLRRRLFLGGDTKNGELNWEQMVAAPATPFSSPALPSADATALLVYTSGTTSAPKAVQHNSNSLWAELLSQSAVRTIVGKEVLLSPWPPGHVAGALSMLRFLCSEQDLILMDEWSAADAVQLIDQHGVTNMSTTPFHLTTLLDAAETQGSHLSSIKSMLTGAAPVPPALITRCEASGLHPFRCYGSSEMPTVSMGRPTDPLEKRLTTEGQLMPDVQIRFLDDDGQDVVEGEIALRGPDLFMGYKDPATQAMAFTSDGWFLSGDVGRLDEDGFLIITDRKKDIIIRGGENISSREVEEALLRHPKILDAAAIAAPHPALGEIVCAILVTKDAQPLTLQEIGEHLRQAGLAKQKTPERLEYVSELPRNAMGKVLKQDLRQQLRPDTGLQIRAAQ